MQILQIGLALFIGVHLVALVAPLKSSLQNMLGAKGYKGVFSLLSLIGFGLIIWGMIEAPRVPVFEPPTWAKTAAFVLVPIALILIASAHMKGLLRAVFRHPMMLGILIWAGVHLAANGDLASLWLFGGFAAYALISLSAGFLRAEETDFEINAKHDFMAIGGGIAMAIVFAFLHPILFGVQLF